MSRYNPKEIEPKWQAAWAKSGINNAVDFDKSREKYVMLTEFPYPSGSGMHIGHMREYTLGDIIARQKRMLGYNVLFPMGYDAFGLPTENYAIKNHISPQQATAQTVANFQSQLEAMGFSFDWSRSFKTSDPDYYKWTQWLFLRFFKAGLAYQDETIVNWCPFCKTGLSNEEVVNGRHERCDTPVTKKQLKQWLLKITDYADRLIEGLNLVDYPSRIADQQVNWIGRSSGVEINFEVKDHKDKSIAVFTTRPDTIYGATFMVLAPEHPLVEQICTPNMRAEVNNYIASAAAKTDLERQSEDKGKSGVFTGAYALNPVNGEEIPIWIADYILMGYGRGAIMAVPAHDERDYAFATTHSLPLKYVIEPIGGETSKSENERERESIIAVLRNPKDGTVLMLDWGPRQPRSGGRLFIGGGMEPNEDAVAAAKREIAEETGYTNIKLVSQLPYLVHSYYYSNVKQADYHARVRGLLFDLVDETQAATNLEQGEAGKFKLVWVAQAQAESQTDDQAHRLVFTGLTSPGPVLGEGIVTGSGSYDGMTSFAMREQVSADLIAKGKATERTNYRMRDWIFSRQRYWGEPIPIIHCPEHGAQPVKESDLPVLLPEIEHYEPTPNGESPLATVAEWVNTTCPKCGKPAKRETDTMPNWAGSCWYYLRYFDPKNPKAFAARDKLDYWGSVDLYLGGMEHTTLHLLYSRFWHQFLFDQSLVPTPEPYLARRGQGIILAADGSKMSKSKGNVVDPKEIIDSGYGADALRLAISFLAPYDQTTPWSPETLGGTYRFLQRLWTLVDEFVASNRGKDESVELKRVVNLVSKQVNIDLEHMSYNTVIAAMMEAVNSLYRLKTKDHFNSSDWQWALETMTKLLAPFAPHIAEELWSNLGGEQSVHEQPWPGYETRWLEQDSVTLAVQIDGKLRGEIVMPVGSSQAEAEAAAKADPKIKPHLASKQIKRVIYVTDKLLSLVLN